MPNETLSAVITIQAPPEVVFAVLADSTSHAAIDGTGWVRESLGGERLTESGQIFRMAMYHDNHPDKTYEMANEVRAFDQPRTISWEPGQYDADGNLGLGGWEWRYDLNPVGESATEVTLTYEWSQVPPAFREVIQFPPFPPQHLDNSLSHLAELAVAQRASAG
ncbi:MAG TPA: SRPBCC family protein [Pseudonocardiaceae bacterium]|jgi:uncharacterized protein YndB with AHSA1/START domain